MSGLSNYIHNKNRASAKKKHIQIYIYIYTRVPPLAEAEKIGLVTGEMSPAPGDDFFPLVLVVVGVPVANTAASKN